MRLDNRNYDRKVYLVKFEIARYLFNIGRYIYIRRIIFKQFNYPLYSQTSIFGETTFNSYCIFKMDTHTNFLLNIHV